MKRTGPHGGSRVGAGRTAPLDKVERLLIGARCEAELASIAETRALRKHKESLPYADIEESRADLDAVPLEIRRRLPAESAEHLAWIADSLEGHRAISTKRPQGEITAIIDRVASEESKRRGLSITPRQVRRWRDEYRAWCKQQRTELDFGQS